MCKIPKKLEISPVIKISHRPYQASKSCMWGTSRKLPVINSSNLLHTKLPSSLCSIRDNHSGACHNVLLSFSQASHLVQGITTSNAQFLKMLKIQKLNISPKNRNESPASSSEQTSRLRSASPNLPASQTSKHQPTRPNLLSQLCWLHLRNTN